MITVTYLHDSETHLYNNGKRWFYGATWMPVGVEHVINVAQDGLEMMLDEKEEGTTPPHGESYDNARRFYRDVVEAELKDAA